LREEQTQKNSWADVGLLMSPSDKAGSVLALAKEEKKVAIICRVKYAKNAGGR
jgi:hypothetical protein